MFSLQAVRILKAGAAGAILALALIHVLGDSFTDFGSLPADAGSDVVLSYPWAALCMLGSIIFMVSKRYIESMFCGTIVAKDEWSTSLIRLCCGLGSMVAEAWSF